MASKRSRRVVITGASGNLGTKLNAHFKKKGWEVFLLDNTKGSRVFCADLRIAGDWERYLEGADTVVHFAAQNPYPDATWQDSASSVDITSNVFLAAVEKKVRRVVFASSNHVMGGYKEEGVTVDEATALTPDMAPFPGTKATYPVDVDATPYATAKLFGERLARALGVLSRGKTSFISLRIGWCQPGENLPRTMSAAGSGAFDREAVEKARKRRGTSTLNDPEKLNNWYQLMWLSNRDFLQIAEKAVVVELPRGVTSCVLNAMSRNSGSRWDTSKTQEIIGYEPQDDVTLHPRPDGEAKITIRPYKGKNKLKAKL